MKSSMQDLLRGKGGSRRVPLPCFLNFRKKELSRGTFASYKVLLVTFRGLPPWRTSYLGLEIPQGASEYHRVLQGQAS